MPIKQPEQHAPPQPQTTCTAALARSPLERRKGLFRRRDGDEAADRRPHAPSGTDAASDSRNADHLATPSLISASTGGPTRGPIPVRSAVRFWQKFLPAAKGGAPRRGIVKRRNRPSPQRVRALPRRSRRPSVRLRSIWHHSTRTPLPCVCAASALTPPGAVVSASGPSSRERPVPTLPTANAVRVALCRRRRRRETTWFGGKALCCGR